MPLTDSKALQEFQTYVSTYTMDGFMNSLLELREIKGWFNSTEVPSKFSFKLNTGTVNLLLPGIAGKYGNDQPVDLHFNVLSVGDFGVSQSKEQITGKATVDLEFWVETTSGKVEKAADLTLQDATFGVTAFVDNMDLTIKIDKYNVDKVIVNSDTFGKVSAKTV